MAALYSVAISVREIAKFASQKAKPPTRVSVNVFFQIPLKFFMYSPFFISISLKIKGLRL